MGLTAFIDISPTAAASPTLGHILTRYNIQPLQMASLVHLITGTIEIDRSLALMVTVLLIPVEVGKNVSNASLLIACIVRNFLSL